MMTFHIDPGHGWLQVDFGDLSALGMSAGDFSRYSYRDAQYAYLEEDCDASKYLARYEAKFGRKPAIREVLHRGDAPIRRMRSIRS